VIRQVGFRKRHSARSYDKFYIWMLVMNLARKLQAIHFPWHVDIGEHQSNRGALS
jgi:hypothetical protein